MFQVEITMSFATEEEADAALTLAAHADTMGVDATLRTDSGHEVAGTIIDWRSR
jgi:hypothetical protein